VRILGVDPGTRATGWGVVTRRGNRIVGVEAGVIRAPEKRPLEERLKLIHDGLVEVLANHAPDAFAVEDLFHAKHANAALRLGHVRGVILLVAANAGLPVHAYAPTLVKKTVAGRGRAGKDQVARLVGAMLGWRDLPAVDATDALAVAITHCQAAMFAEARGG
jgi:crossover junction endodeoxyribonuclease RuvC